MYLDQEQRVKSVMIGRLSPGDSFGEITVLKGLPMPCSVITDTHVQIGTISTLDVHGRYFDTSSPPSQPSPDQLSPLPSSLPLIRRLSLRFTVFLDLFHTRRFWHCWFWHCAGCVSPLNRVLAWFTLESLALKYSICAWNFKIWSSIPCGILRPVFFFCPTPVTVELHLPSFEDWAQNLRSFLFYLQIE